jgi:hypothetical protein
LLAHQGGSMTITFPAPASSMSALRTANRFFLPS